MLFEAHEELSTTTQQLSRLQRELARDRRRTKMAIDDDKDHQIAAMARALNELEVIVANQEDPYDARRDEREKADRQWESRLALLEEELVQRTAMEETLSRQLSEERKVGMVSLASLACEC